MLKNFCESFSINYNENKKNNNKYLYKKENENELNSMSMTESINIDEIDSILETYRNKSKVNNREIILKEKIFSLKDINDNHLKKLYSEDNYNNCAQNRKMETKENCNK